MFIKFLSLALILVSLAKVESGGKFCEKVTLPPASEWPLGQSCVVKKRLFRMCPAVICEGKPCHGTVKCAAPVKTGLDCTFVKAKNDCIFCAASCPPFQITMCATPVKPEGSEGHTCTLVPAKDNCSCSHYECVP
jgi:hypothetical protein